MHFPRQLKQQSKILYHFNLLKLVNAEPKTSFACFTQHMETCLQIRPCLHMIDFYLAQMFEATQICGTGVSLFPTSAETWEQISSRLRHCFLKCPGKVMERLSARIMRKGGWWVKRYFEAHQQSHIQKQRGIIALTSGKRPREVL